LIIYGKKLEKVQGLVCIPGKDLLHKVMLKRERTAFSATSTPIPLVSFNIVERFFFVKIVYLINAKSILGVDSIFFYKKMLKTFWRRLITRIIINT